MTIDELMQHPQFANALRTFYWMQEWRLRNRNVANREELLIREMLEDHYGWIHMAGNPTANKNVLDQMHKEVGYLIAHNFPMFATLCTKPIYVVFDYADRHHNGRYRLASYPKSDCALMEDLAMEIAKVAVFQNTKTGQRYTRIKVYEPFFIHRGPDYIVDLCRNHYPSPYYFVIFDGNNVRELDYNNSGININDPAWQMASPVEANLMLE